MGYMERKREGQKMKALSDIGLVGLGVMGRSLALNMESKGLQVSVFNYVQAVTDEFIAGPAVGKNFVAASSYESLVASLSSPRKVFLMITAGKAVDEVISQLLPLLSEGDVIIDGGNSDYRDTTRRTRELREKGLLYVGTGVSGGEEGALKGPSLMPGGTVEAWPLVAPVFRAIAAKASDGSPCCEWMGPEGAGHYVKMVHNGIEYGDIELICECYQLMRDGLGMDNEGMHEVFSEWNEGPLSSYLISITADVLTKKDGEGNYILDRILDTAGQKGTGKWTVEAALEAGVPLTLIGEAVFARCLSARKEERVAASAQLAGPSSSGSTMPSSFAPSDRWPCRPENGRLRPGILGSTIQPHGMVVASDFLPALCDALYAAKIVSYAQGFSLLQEASKAYGWALDCGKIARIWRGGCIIRSVFLDSIHDAFSAEVAAPANLMLAPFFRDALAARQGAWRRVVCAAVEAGLPVPALSSALAYYDSYRCSRSGANLLQAQRDYFGAHTYERIDRPRGEFFHTEW